MVAAGSITVAVRVRPPTSWEAARLPQQVYDECIRGDGALSTPGRVANTSPLRDIVEIVDDRVLTFDPQEKDQARAFVERGFVPPGTKRYKDRRFIFDRVFRHDATQQQVYQGTARPLLSNLLDGYNTTIFAYGATGCGKTHTISGTDADPGIIYLTMADLFQEIEDRREDHTIDVAVTFLEIYNEEIRDLLSEPGTPTPRGGLQIREDKTVKVVGLTELRPANADAVKEIVLLGNSRRTQSPTHANETSSRSHAVLQVHITQAPRTAAITEQRTMATLSIIDLAGSERAAATTNMGQRMVEGANINKSLLALGNCINALCESGGAIRHIPYRNSKLTRLLKFSLGGNCKTVMIVCVAPTSAHFDDTHNTLIYAERATKIKTKVVTRNVVDVNRHVGQYVEAINRLNLEVAELKEKLAGKRDAEREIEKRKRREALVEVEKAKSDLQLKADQMQPSIADGANCAGKIAVAEAKLKVIRARLAELDAQASSSSSSLSPDLETERALLQALAGPEEQVLKAESALNVRMQRANNSGALFDATLRAVQERRSSERLDEVSVENVKLDARWRKAEMERIKAEARQEALREAVTAQAEAVVSLVGLVGRCTVMLNEASKALEAATEDGRDGLEPTAKSLSTSLKGVADGNDAAFKSLLGHSIAAYASSAAPQANLTSLGNFSGYASLGHGRVVSGPTVSQQTKAKVSRRSSSYGSSVGSPLRKSHKSPRKSLRSSLAPSAAPYRRVSDKDKGKKKGVQWRDYAGQGDIDDGGQGSAVAPVVISVTSADASSTSFSLPESSQRNVSIGGSESEWEDEKTDTSLDLSLFSAPSTSSAASSSSVIRGAGPRRPRASRLDPGFLKSRTRGSTLGSLAEDDEERAAAMGSPRRGNPLSDRNMNRASSPSDESNSSQETATGKARERHHGSPAKRVPLTPKAVGVSKAGRRRSNIGPMRSERPRRRSSMIPQLSPQGRASLGGAGGSSGTGKSSSGPRRVAIGASPAKRPKRMSLLAVSSARLHAGGSLRGKGVDPNASMDTSFRSAAGGSRPTWR
ncbi:kinesin-domain-containing protein [Trametes maxima]|nr:kinesin-domain-containing protein [Trametes maxima]